MRLLRKTLTFCRAPVQEVLFWSRSLLRLRRGPPRLVGGAAHEVGRELAQRYDLAAFAAVASEPTWRDSVWRLAALERLFSGCELPPGTLRAVDVGCQSWSYAFALARFLTRWSGPRELELTGYEIDAYAPLPDLRSRHDWAMAYLAQVDFARLCYEPSDFLRCAARELHVATLFFPFVTRYALLEWGLPLSCFGPRRLLGHVAQCLAPGGYLATIHQTAAEAEITRELLAQRGDVVLVREAVLDSELAPEPELAEGRVGLLFRTRTSSAGRS